MSEHGRLHALINPLVVVTLLTFSGPVLAHEIKGSTITLKHPWVRAVEKGEQTTTGSVRITNTGTRPDKLIGAKLRGAVAATFAAGSPEQPDAADTVLEAITIPPGGTVELGAGAPVIIFTGISRGLEADSYVDGSLTFEVAGRMDLEFYVEAVATPSGAPASTGDGTPAVQ